MSQKRNFTHLQAEQSEIGFQNQHAFNQQPSQKSKIFYLIIFALMIICTVINFFGPTFFSANKADQSLYPNQNQVQSQQAQQQGHSYIQSTISSIPQISQRRNGTRYHAPISSKAKQRISYGQPRPKNSTIRAVILEKKNKTDTNNDVCSFTNGVNIISNKTITTALNLLKVESVSKWIVFLSFIDEVGDRLISQIQPNLKDMNVIRVKQVVVDSNYQFVTKHIKGCESIVYLQNPFVITPQNAVKLVDEAKQLQQKLIQGYVGYSQGIYDEQGTKIFDNLSNIDLRDFSEQKVSRYIFVIDSNLFSVITPLNFVYFNKYTFQHLFIYPILALTQKSKFLVQIKGLLYTYDEVVSQHKQFALTQVQLGNNIKCFVSYPSDPKQIDLDEFKSYATAISQIQNNKATPLVVYLPYDFEQKTETSLQSFYEILRQIKKKNDDYKIRIRIVWKKAFSSLAAYQSAHVYCPQSSLMILSRFNINFNKKFLNEIESSYSAKSHYYHTGKLNLKEDQKLSEVIAGKNNKQRFNSFKYVSDLSHVQIFKSDFMKMINLWILKSDQNSFYETEASFVIPLLQMIDYEVAQIQTLYKISQPRKSSDIETFEIKRLQKYGRWEKITNNILQPIPYNSLTNLDLRRNHLNQIPKIIHQVWFKQQKIPTQIENIQKTIKEVNKGYKYMLWKRQNMTYYDFPMSYAFVARTIQYEWAYQKNLHHWVQALISYEVLHNHGGIYLGLNVEAKKPLDYFLKYELFFSGFYGEMGTYQSPISFGRDIIGAKRYSYHMRFVLSELITEQIMDYAFPDYQAIVGGDILRTSMTDDELFTTVGYGFHLFNFDPFKGGHAYCELTQLPCKQYDQAYVVLHSLI